MSVFNLFFFNIFKKIKITRKIYDYITELDKTGIPILLCNTMGVSRNTNKVQRTYYTTY